MEGNMLKRIGGPNPFNCIMQKSQDKTAVYKETKQMFTYNWIWKTDSCWEQTCHNRQMQSMW